MDSRIAAINKPAPLEVAVLERSPDPHWDAFVEREPEGTFFHLSGWKSVIERSFGHATRYLYAHRGGEIEGVLPLGHLRSRLFGHSLISVPFCVYGGTLARTTEARDALEAAALDFAKEVGVDYLELRNLKPQHPDWHHKDIYVTFRKEIDADSDKNMKAIPRKQRAIVRKGIDSGLTATVESDVRELHRIYAESVRNLGTPVFSERYFRNLKETFGDKCEIAIVRHGGQALAGVMSFFLRDVVYPYYGGGTKAARQFHANDFQYWALMERAVQRGVRVFDYGRSRRETGSYHFKRHWGFEPEPLHYEYALVRARSLPDVSPNNPKYKLFISAWKRMPTVAHRVIGPWIARNLA